MTASGAETTSDRQPPRSTNLAPRKAWVVRYKNHFSLYKKPRRARLFERRQWAWSILELERQDDNTPQTPARSSRGVCKGCFHSKLTCNQLRNREVTLARNQPHLEPRGDASPIAAGGGVGPEQNKSTRKLCRRTSRARHLRITTLFVTAADGPV